MYMPFGKHAGQRISDLPTHYLEWLLAQHWLREPLKSTLGREYSERCAADEQQPHHEPLRVADRAVVETATEIVGAGYRTLAKRLHPDAGGSHESMIALNAARDFLHSVIEGYDAAA